MDSKTNRSIHCTLITKTDENGNVRLDHNAFNSFLERMNIDDKPICVVSISGQARRGKSFLMNLIRRYVEKSGWQNDWIGDEGEEYQIDRFHAAKGKHQVTVGILLYNEVYEVPWKDQKMTIILMDTQGLFNSANRPSVDKFLLTLTTLMSSVQLFNVLSQVDTNELNYLNAAIEYSKKSTESDDNNCYLKLQEFVILVRDAIDDDEDDYLEEILDGSNMADEYKGVVSNLKSTFTHIKLYMLPQPGKKVVHGSFHGAISRKDIGEEFLDDVNRFLTEVINPRRSLVPKLWKGEKPLKGKDLLKIMASCDNLFSKNADIDISSASSRIMEANQRVYYENQFEEAFNQFSEEIENISTEDMYEMEEECKKVARRAMVKYVRASANLVGEEGKQHYDSYKRRLSKQTDNIIRSKLRMLEMENKQKAEKREEKTQLKFMEYKKKMNLFVDADGANIEEQHGVISSQIMQNSEGVDRTKLTGLMAKYLTKRKSLLQKRRRNNEARTAVENNERRKSIAQQLHIQLRSLDELWKQKLNALANGKRKQVRPVVSAEEIPWKDFKLLSLSHQEVAQVAPKIESESRRKYWAMNLTDVEKYFNCELNRKLRDVFSTHSTLPQCRYVLESELLPEASAGSLKFTRTAVYERWLLQLEQEFEDYLEKHESSSKGLGSYSLHVKKVVDLHKKFLNWCSSELFVKLQRLDAELNDKKEEFLQLRKKHVAAKQLSMLLALDLNIEAMEQSLKKEMATKHVDPQNLRELYSVFKLKHLDPLRTLGMMGFRPSRDLDEFFTEAVDARIAASLKRILAENESNRSLVVLQVMKMLLTSGDDEDSKGPKKKKGFFQRLFGKKNS